MSAAIGIVGLLGLLALAVVGAATFHEVRPVVRAWRERRRRHPWAYQETVRVVPVQRFTAGRTRDNIGHFVTFLLGLALLTAAFWEWSRLRFQAEWPTAAGTVLETRLERAAGPENRVNVSLRFTYVVDEREYTGIWVEQEGGALLANFQSAQAFLSRYHAGQPIDVWYHPWLPSYPSLVRVTLWYVVLALVIGSVLLVTSGLSLLASLRLFSALERDTPDPYYRRY